MAVKSLITAIADIKPGRLEELQSTFAAFQTPELLAQLSNIGLIHFAHWAIIDNDTRLVFVTNFDGNWDDYLDEFIAKGADELDVVFGHCVGYPEGGCRDVETFKQYIRDHEYKAAVSYTAYPDATVIDVQKALRIRQKFEAFLDEFQ